MKRRDSLKLIAVAPLSAGLACTELTDTGSKPKTTAAPGVFHNYERQFFTDHEFRTVRLLSDMIIPADDRSGNASDAKVPEFIDFTVMDRPELQTRIRGGLNWLDYRCQKRFGSVFADCDEAQRREVVEEIAWPDTAAPEVKIGVRFFNDFRDLVASGFWSSPMGVEDLQYMGNTAIPSWEGCPPEALKRLGVDYG